MSLLDVMEVDQTDINTLVIIDLHNMIFRNLFIAHNILNSEENKDSNPLTDNFNLWKHLMLNGLYGYVKQFSADRLVVAMEGRNYWRRGVYAAYKGNRAAARDESPIDFEKFFPIMDQFLDELRIILPSAMFLKIDKAEADDVIAVLSKNVSTNKTIIVSNDKDMYQLHKYPWIKQWNPIKKNFVEILSPDRDLQIKILTGDPGDNIPSVGKKINRKIGPVNAKKILDNFEEEMKNPALFEAYNLNKTLIDFSCIPESISKEILDTYNNYKVGKYVGRTMYQYMIERDMQKNLENLQDFNKVFGELK